MKQVRQFINNVKRVVDYIPLVWSIRDYDYIYSVEVFKHQLRRQRDYFLTNAHIEDAHVHAQNIETALSLLEVAYETSEPKEQIRAHNLCWRYIEHNIQTWWD